MNTEQDLPMNDEQNSPAEVATEQQQIEPAPVEMVDLQLIQVRAVMEYAKDMYDSLNNIINSRNEKCVTDSEKAFMSKVVERRDFYNEISDICYKSMKPYLAQINNDFIDHKNYALARQTEQLISSGDSNKFITDEQAFGVLDTVRRQMLHSVLETNKVIISTIKVPKVVFTSLNLI